LGALVPPPPPPLWHPPDCNNDVFPVTHLIQSQCAPYPRLTGGARGGDYIIKMGLLRWTKYFQFIDLKYDFKDWCHQMMNHHFLFVIKKNMKPFS